MKTLPLNTSMNKWACYTITGHMDPFYSALLHLLEDGTTHQIKTHLTKTSPDLKLYESRAALEKIATATIKRDDKKIFNMILDWAFHSKFTKGHPFLDQLDDHFRFFVDPFIKHKPSKITSLFIYTSISNLAKSVTFGVASPEFFTPGQVHHRVQDGSAIGHIIKSCDMKTLLTIVTTIAKESNPTVDYKKYAGNEIFLYANRLANIYSRTDFPEIEALSPPYSKIMFEYMYHSTPITLICRNAVLHTPRLINIVLKFGPLKYPKRMIMNSITQIIRTQLCQLHKDPSKLNDINSIFYFLSEDLYQEITAEYSPTDEELYASINYLYGEALIKKCYKIIKFVLCFLKYFKRDLSPKMCEFTTTLPNRKNLVLLAMEKEYIQKCFYQSLTKDDYTYLANLQIKQLTILTPFFSFLSEWGLTKIISEYVGIDKQFVHYTI